MLNQTRPLLIGVVGSGSVLFANILVGHPLIEIVDFFQFTGLEMHHRIGLDLR